MDKWLKEELEKIGAFQVMPIAPQNIEEIRARHEEEGAITIENSEVLTWIEHDEQLVKALSIILNENLERFCTDNAMKKNSPALYEYIIGLYSVTEIILNRNATTTLKLQDYVSDSLSP